MENYSIPQAEKEKSYQQIDSEVDGITVFSPISEPTQEALEKEYKCPQCGAVIQYKITADGLSCDHCGFVAKIQSQKVGAAANLSEFTLQNLNQAQKGWGVARKILHCRSCGASLSLSESALTSTCPFCASLEVYLQQGEEDFIRPKYLVPFKVLNENIRSIARDWLGKGWFHPAELASSAVIDKFIGLYLPFWTFSAKINSSWKAEVGYEHTSRYYDHHSGQWRSRVEIKWRWESGNVGLEISDLLVGGSTQISEVIARRIYPFNLNDLVEFNPDYLAGWQAQAYNVTLIDAWNSGKEQMREKAKNACRSDIHSSHVRNMSVAADLQDEAWRNILLPIYLASYKFKDKLFQVMINGQSGTISGQKPVEWTKIWLAIAACLLPGAFLGLIGLPLSLLGGLGIILIAIGFVLLVIGGGIAWMIYRQAMESEAA
jgi:predicted RNA-binding Zn-ribbon protein involved in translation (DUF1610 family)